MRKSSILSILTFASFIAFLNKVEFYPAWQSFAAGIAFLIFLTMLIRNRLQNKQAARLP